MDRKETDLVFRYSREERLRRAPPAVRALEEWRKGGKRGFFSFLKGNKGLAITMTTVLAFGLMAIFFTLVQSRSPGGLDAFKVSAKARRVDGIISLALAIEPRAGATASDKEAKVATVTVSTDGSSFTRKEAALAASGATTLFFSLPDTGGDKVWLILGYDGKTREWTLPVEKGE